MDTYFINSALLKDFELDRFKKNEPFPWFNFQSFLTPAAFYDLYSTFPSLDLFEKHTNLSRNYGQRPHNRYYLAYEKSIYKTSDQPYEQGVVRHEELSLPWQQFIEELKKSQIYNNFIKDALEAQNYYVRYAWHLGHSGSEVSPHRDSPTKIGTHIFYFNTSDDWNMTWGGSTLVLGDKLTDANDPDFSDFTEIVTSQISDNHSFLFKNTSNAWHGVKPLTCPEGKYRRLFNVIFEVPETQEVSSKISSRLGLSMGRIYNYLGKGLGKKV